MKSSIYEPSDQEFANIVKNNYSYVTILKALGYVSCSGSAVNILKRRITELSLDTSHFVYSRPRVLTRDDVFVQDSTVAQKTLRQWFLKEKDIKYECSICGQSAIQNGEQLTLILDHINGQNHDNRLSNLRQVCPNCNQQLETTNGKNIKHGERIHIDNKCVDCGKKITNKSTRCIKCERIHRALNEPKQITRDNLKNLIRTMSFKTIGRLYGVSDNAVRKWCDKYGLPRKARDIKRYNDQEQEKL